jgi:hypothetical protein
MSVSQLAGVQCGTQLGLANLLKQNSRGEVPQMFPRQRRRLAEIRYSARQPPGRTRLQSKREFWKRLNNFIFGAYVLTGMLAYERG